VTLIRIFYVACVMMTAFAVGASLGWLEMSEQAKKDAQ
jgi:hypothetical protein